KQPFHPLHAISANDSNWLRFIWKLKRARDASAHGDNPDLKRVDVIKFRKQVYQSLSVLVAILHGAEVALPEKPHATDSANSFNERFATRV
ncbi:hypothetical protein DF186_15850, partial [Enterococcus hirae]